MFQFGVGVFSSGPFSSPENMTRMAQRAEALGFDFLMISDHVILPRQLSNDPGHNKKNWRDSINFFDPLVTMMFLGGITKRIRIGTTVLILPYRPPLQTAKAIASLDVLTGGRVFIGAGTGWWKEEFEALGIADHYATRGDRTDEHIRIFRTAWSQEEPTFSGPYHSFRDIEFSPKPIQRPGPPIWIGGNNPRAFRRMAELGDVWHPSSTGQPMLMNPEGFGGQWQKVRGAFEKAKRDPATLQAALKRPVKLLPKGAQPVDALIGPAAHVVAGVHAYRAHGLTHLVALVSGGDFLEAMDQMEQLAAEVIPHCR